MISIRIALCTLSALLPLVHSATSTAATLNSLFLDLLDAELEAETQLLTILNTKRGVNNGWIDIGEEYDGLARDNRNARVRFSNEGQVVSNYTKVTKVVYAVIGVDGVEFVSASLCRSGIQALQKSEM